jgi:hypothetical protein
MLTGRIKLEQCDGQESRNLKSGAKLYLLAMKESKRGEYGTIQRLAATEGLVAMTPKSLHLINSGF